MSDRIQQSDQGMSNLKELKYSIFDPTGNITALVETDIAAPYRPAAAAAVMERHPEVEQVGFVQFTGDKDIQVRLNMAGGEFCGNATMSAASLFIMRSGDLPGNEKQRTVYVDASGVDQPVRVDLMNTNGSGICVHMPQALGVEEASLAPDSKEPGSLIGKMLLGSLPLVRLPGISHLIIESDSFLYSMKNSKETAENIARLFCDEIKAEGLGIMFLDQIRPYEVCELTPLVYVPKSNTIFWEHACASGAAACAAELARKAGTPVDISFRQPGGVLRVSCEPGGEILLYGQTVLTGSGELTFS